MPMSDQDQTPPKTDEDLRRESGEFAASHITRVMRASGFSLENAAKIGELARQLNEAQQTAVSGLIDAEVPDDADVNDAAKALTGHLSQTLHSAGIAASRAGYDVDQVNRIARTTLKALTLLTESAFENSEKVNAFAASLATGGTAAN